MTFPTCVFGKRQIVLNILLNISFCVRLKTDSQMGSKQQDTIALNFHFRVNYCHLRNNQIPTRA